MDPYDIYSVNDDLIATMTREKCIELASFEFSQIKSNAMKVKLVLSYLLRYDHMPDLKLCRAKNNERARQIRQKGNQLFALKGVNLYKALELYNQSLCIAVPNTQDHGIALANRSAVYLELRNPELCLKNIHIALESGYPLKLMEKLKKRGDECIEIMKKMESITASADAAVTTEKTEPRIEKCMERRESEAFGRHVVSTNLIYPLERLVVEDPFTCVLLPALRFERCWHCLQEKQQHLFPCKRCTQVMFCSYTCADAANISYHAYECPIIDYLLPLFNKMHLLALRVVIKGVLAFGSLAKIGAFLEKHGETKVDVFTKVTDGMYENDEQQKFHQIYSLQTNQENRSNSDLFQRATVAAVMFLQVAQNTSWSKECESSESARNVLLELLFHFLQTCPTNFHSLSVVESVDVENSIYGSAAYPFASLLNHSCSPNVMRVACNSQQMIMALRVIQPGEQLFDNYGFHHCLQSAQLRRKNLFTQYHFYCQCIACKENYPPYVNLPKAKIPDGVPSGVMERLQRFAPGPYVVELANFKAYLAKYDRHYPCEQLSNVQECMKMCLQILFGNVPMAMQPVRDPL